MSAPDDLSPETPEGQRIAVLADLVREQVAGPDDVVALVTALLRREPPERVAEVLARLLEVSPEALGMVRRAPRSGRANHEESPTTPYIEALSWGTEGWALRSGGEYSVRSHGGRIHWVPTRAEALAALEALAPVPVAIVRGGP